jgi:hypothetical protein
MVRHNGRPFVRNAIETLSITAVCIHNPMKDGDKIRFGFRRSRFCGVGQMML